MSWREEARQDRLVRAQIDRDQAEAAARLRLADRQAAATGRRTAGQARAVARASARRDRAARRAALAAWVTAHVVDLLFVPVIIVPGLLAWTAMAGYGHQVYGAPGWSLPVFSEGSMWAFAAANTLTRRQHPDRPTWHLQAGTWLAAAAAGALNFVHGMAASGPATGAVMAVVSVAGVTVHQLVTAGPRRSRTDRDTGRLARAAARRELAVRRAAVRDAVAALDAGGLARLVYRPGTVTLARRHGRTVLVPAVVPGLPVTPAADGDGIDWDAELAGLDATAVTGPAHGPGCGESGGGGVAVADRPGNTAALAGLVELARAAISRGDIPPDPSQRALRDLLGIRMARAGQVQRALNDRRNP